MAEKPADAGSIAGFAMVLQPPTMRAGEYADRECMETRPPITASIRLTETPRNSRVPCRTVKRALCAEVASWSAQRCRLTYCPAVVRDCPAMWPGAREYPASPAGAKRPLVAPRQCRQRCGSCVQVSGDASPERQVLGEAALLLLSESHMQPAQCCAPDTVHRMARGRGRPPVTDPYLVDVALKH